MSRKISFKGVLNIGVQQKINLETNKGKTGYKIKKFQLMSTLPGQSAKSVEYVGKIYSIKQTNLSSDVFFDDGNLLAAIHHQDQHASDNPASTTVIFDNEIVNQDIFIYVYDADGDTVPANYYIELEAMPLTDLQSTQLTLKSLRSIAS